MPSGSPAPEDRYQVRSENRRRRHDTAAAASLDRLRRLAGDSAAATAALQSAITQLRADTSQRYAAARLGLTPKEMRVIEERGYATPAQIQTITEHLDSTKPAAPDDQGS